MQRISKPAQAGTLESGDIMITVSPKDDSAIDIELESIVMLQYGQAIRQVIGETLSTHGFSGIYVKATDRGALDFTVRARTMTALVRAGGKLKEHLP